MLSGVNFGASCKSPEAKYNDCLNQRYTFALLDNCCTRYHYVKELERISVGKDVLRGSSGAKETRAAHGG